jgi:hypothetical protein
MKIYLKFGAILAFAGVLAALSPAPNLVPDHLRKHNSSAPVVSDQDLQRAQALAKPTSGEIGNVQLSHPNRAVEKDTDGRARSNLQAAQHYSPEGRNSAKAAAALKVAQARLNDGKRTPLQTFMWLFVAACLGYGFFFFVRHWADKNIPTPRGMQPATPQKTSAKPKW